ncbi:MAG: hypothetical protein L6R39_007522 [Caloplaca ligustica]|nr:MAG: hypothetical protein L6R39_007522 [Caloplaca ligustica]
MSAEQFTQYYYSTFDADRSNLAALYREQSMLTFESTAVGGTAGIVEKLTSLPFTKIKHQVATLDAQPSNEQGGIIVMVTGALLVSPRPTSSIENAQSDASQVDDEERPMNYTQVFQLLPDGAGSYFVFNDMFKLIYG